MTNTNQIRFFEANKGGIELFSAPGVKIGFAQTAKDLTKLLNKFDFQDGTAHFGSSMDFADEYGFTKREGAFDMLVEGFLNSRNA
tara:strand:+ start:57 stop:311 length:255 start_codon:yes stop_codon:yes gene_type:complete